MDKLTNSTINSLRQEVVDIIKIFRELKSKLENNKGELYIISEDGRKTKLEDFEIYVGGLESKLY